jgi:hypothetical protein
MKHEQETIKMLEAFGDQRREAAAFKQDFARIAIEAAARYGERSPY